MKIQTEDFRVFPDKKVKIKKWATSIDPLYKSKDDYQEDLNENIKELSELQNLLYAHNKYSVLLIFQAMDAAGKDSMIKHVMSGINPQGCQVFSFKHPGPEELDHDFLWRSVRCLPERGRIGIFNRSYYEEVLIVKVEPEILKAQMLPDEMTANKNFWEKRYQSIKEFEKHLQNNGTCVIKFFLNLSKNEQAKRFIQRIDRPDKNWKFSSSDIKVREKWDQYMEVYEDCLSETSTEKSPWYIVPADDKQNSRLIVSKIIVETLNKLKMSYPQLEQKQIAELKSIRESLEKQIK